MSLLLHAHRKFLDCRYRLADLFRQMSGLRLQYYHPRFSCGAWWRATAFTSSLRATHLSVHRSRRCHCSSAVLYPHLHNGVETLWKDAAMEYKPLGCSLSEADASPLIRDEGCSAPAEEDETPSLRELGELCCPVPDLRPAYVELQGNCSPMFQAAVPLKRLSVVLTAARIP